MYVSVCARTGDGLPEVDLWRAHIHLDVELALHPLDVYLHVQLAHAAQDGLAAVTVGVATEGGILFDETVDSL